jgi:hypothetical protein
MIEIIYAFCLSVVKFIISLFYFSKIKQAEPKGLMKKLLIFISVENLIFFICAVLITSFVELDKIKFMLVLMLLYFIFLTIEVLKIKKQLSINLHKSQANE